MPSTESPWNQLLSSSRLRSKGDLTKLTARLWRGINITMAGLDSAMAADDPEEIRRWLHCLGQLSHVYIKSSLDGDLELRLSQLERKLSEPS